MKSLRTLVFSFTLGIAVGTSATLTVAQGFATPGPEHQTLKKHEGEWIAKIKSGEGESRGALTAKMECGGLWLVTDFRGEFGGQPFQGRGMDSYDPGKKKYVSVWVDSMSTRPMLFEGDFDKEKKTLTMIGEGTGPDGQPMKFKSVTKFPDDDHQSIIMYLVGSDGSENEMLSIEYTRKK